MKMTKVFTILVLLLSANVAHAEFCVVNTDLDLVSGEDSYNSSFRKKVSNLSGTGCDLSASHIDSNHGFDDGGTDSDGMEHKDLKRAIMFNTEYVTVNYDSNGNPQEDYIKIKRIKFEKENGPVVFNAKEYTAVGNVSYNMVRDELYGSTYGFDVNNYLIDYVNQNRDIEYSLDTIMSLEDSAWTDYGFDAGTVILDFRDFNVEDTEEYQGDEEIVALDEMPIQCAENSADIGFRNVIFLFPDQVMNKYRGDPYILRRTLFDSGEDKTKCFKDHGAVFMCVGDLLTTGPDGELYNPAQMTGDLGDIDEYNDLNAQWCSGGAASNDDGPAWEFDPDREFSPLGIIKWYVDRDGDGYGWDDPDTTTDTKIKIGDLTDPQPPQNDPVDEDGNVIGVWVRNGDDCNDEDININPDAAEVCDGIDNNCNGEIDEEGAVDGTLVYKDYDGDTYGGEETTICEETEEPADYTYVEVGGDCDDSDEDINPAAEELCGDGVDNNCDGNIDDECTGPYYNDVDGDGYGDDATETTTYSEGVVTVGGDCNDDDPTVNPGVEELCGDNADNNCDGQIDEECVAETDCTDGFDNDGDGFQDCEDSDCDCADLDGDGFSVVDGDCDDSNPDIYPGATEVCNYDNIDYDCDGVVNPDMICILESFDPNANLNEGGGFIKQDGGSVDELLGCTLNPKASIQKKHVIILVGLFILPLVTLVGFRRRSEI